MSDIVPVIDMAPLFTNDGEAKRQIAKQIDAACRGSGFFQIKNHGVGDVLDELIERTPSFYKNLSYDEKVKYAPKKWNKASRNLYRGYFPAAVNGKEGLDMGNPFITEDHPLVQNHDPTCTNAQEETYLPGDDKLPGFKTFMNQHYVRMLDVARVLLRGFALAMDKQEDYFEDKVRIEDTMSTLRLNYYPFTDDSQPIEIGSDGVKLGCETHADVVIITILYQPSLGGLQVLHQGQWIDVEPSKENFVVNTGQFLQRWTNGVYHGAFHRVKLLNTERISVPFFVEPAYDTLIESATPGDPSAPPLHPPVKYGDYLREILKQRKEYSDRT